MASAADSESTFDLSKLEKLLADSDYINLTEEIKENLTPKTAGDCLRDEESKSKISFVSTALDKTLQNISSEPNDDLFALAAQCYRVLRNMSAFSPELQTYIACKTTVFQTAGKMLDFLQTQKNVSPKCYLSLMQFIGNNTVQNSKTQQLVWDHFEKQILHCLDSTAELSNVAAMIIYNVLLGDKTKIENHVIYILKTLETNSSKDIPYTEIIYEYYITNWDTQLSKLYNELPSTVKLLIFEITKNMIQDERTLSPSYLQFLANEFKVKSDCILKTVSTYVEGIEPQEVVSLLNILASASGMESYKSCFQDDKSLFINCAFLLRAMHSMGKEGDNHFTSIQRLADLAPGRTDVEIEAHIAYGFKGQLIRMLGNLMYKNPVNQKQIREIDCVGVLLDCCNMDARNPLIMQWVILAVRNMCEDCPENQAIILEMRKESSKFTNLCEKAGIVNFQ